MLDPETVVLSEIAGWNLGGADFFFQTTRGSFLDVLVQRAWSSFGTYDARNCGVLKGAVLKRVSHGPAEVLRDVALSQLKNLARVKSSSDEGTECV